MATAKPAFHISQECEVRQLLLSRRPVHRAVDDTGYEHFLAHEPVNDDVGCSRNPEFARSSATAWSFKLRKRFEQLNAGQYGFNDAGSDARSVVPRDPRVDVLKVGLGPFG